MRLLIPLVTVAMACVSVAAQTPAFDVVSIKPNNSVSPAMNNRFTPGRTVLINYSPAVLVQDAYRIRGYQLVNLPDWARNERFDVEATYPPDTPPARRQEMLQKMLADRFELRVHRETRELPIYAMVRVRPDALGPGLRPATRDCTPKVDGTGKRVFAPECGYRITGDSVSGHGEWASMALPLQIGIRDRPVIDRTGLSGPFDIDLKWLPDGAPDTGDRVSVFTAVQEQLGLRLESTKGPIEVLVIDALQRPTPD